MFVWVHSAIPPILSVEFWDTLYIGRTYNSVSQTLLYYEPPTSTRFPFVDAGGPVVIIFASGSEVRGFDSGWGRWIFSERKNPEYDFLRKGSKAVGPVSWIYGK